MPRRAASLPATLLLLLALLIGLGARPAAATEADLALVIAVDISNSMDPEEQELQRQGFVEAFRSEIVHQAVARGALGRVAVAYMEWAGVANQQVVAPWTVLETPAQALAFADRLAAAPIRRAPRTSISGAIDFSVRMLSESGVDAPRQVIDVSGDGANNQGRLVTQARDEALAKGITINGLPVMLKRASGSWDTKDLDLYYRDCVIGGVGAFMVPVRERSQFVEAVKTKVIREIAGITPPARVIPAQAEARTSCLSGEWGAWERN